MTSGKGSARSKPTTALRRLLITLLALISFRAEAQFKPRDRRNSPRPPDPLVSTPEEAGEAIRHAYDAISRTGLLLNARTEGIAYVSEIHSQSKIAYQEALSCYQSKDYVAGREQAMASADLSRALEELGMSVVEFGGGAKVPGPPGDAEEHDRTAEDLDNLEYRLRAIQRRQLPNHVIPSEEARLIESLIVQSGHLLQQAQDLLLRGQAARAGHTARAGDALTHAAEHVENRYLLAAGIRPAPVGPPPGPERHPPPPPRPGP